MPTSSLGLVILAAGSGKRFGMPKALAIYNNQTFLDIILAKVRKLKINYVSVINQEVKDTVSTQNLNYVLNQPEQDMCSSVRLGLKSLNECSGWIVWPVDHPFVDISTLESMIDSFDFESVLIPSYHKKAGHPILLPTTINKYIEVCKSLKETLAFMKVRYLDVEDRHILTNINYKEDIPNDKLL